MIALGSKGSVGGVEFPAFLSLNREREREEVSRSGDCRIGDNGGNDVSLRSVMSPSGEVGL